MNARLSEGSVVHKAKRILVLASLAILVLFCGGPGWAQSQPAQMEPTAVRPVANAPATSSAAPSSSATPAAKQKVVQGLPVKRSTPRGQHEGITVHGHWVIEVRNPDGKLVGHHEFENALFQPSGAQYLTSFLLGTIAPGGYDIRLGNASAGTSPCNTGGYCLLVGSLISPTPSGFVDTPAGCSSSSPCPLLTITPASNVTGIVLSGTLTAIQSAEIADVYVDPLTCGPTFFAVSSPVLGTAPSTCAASATTLIGILTHANLPAQGSGACGGANQTICAVPVIADQTISVTVTLSFQ